MRILPGRDPGWEPRCPTARELVAPPVPDDLPPAAASPGRSAPEGLDDFRHWDADAQERALELLRQAEARPYRPFYCPRPGCDGLPHDNWLWNHARADQHMPSLRGDWLVWLLSGGRGSGKTRTGAETFNRAAKHVQFLRMIAPTGPDIRDTMVEGEALALDTAVPAPSGWTTMGQLAIGDVIYAGDGSECTVTHAFPVLHGRDCFELMVEGQRIVADGQHKWVTSTHAERSYGARDCYPMDRYESVRTTQEIVQTTVTGGLSWRCREHGISVSCIHGTKTELDIDLYTLGYWLGDGSSRSAHITSHPDDQVFVREFIEQAGYETRLSLGQDRQGYTFLVRGLSSQLRNLGVLGNKHLPEFLLMTSRDQRLDLIAGLMDSDGTISERGQFEFSNKNDQIAWMMMSLLSSVGIKASVTSNHGQWRVRGTTSEMIFRLPRKAARLPKPSAREQWRYIKSVKQVKSVPVRCIAVDSADRTFLVGKQFIRTHNSGILATAPPDFRPQWEPSKKKLTWPNGAVALGFSAEEPDRLRGKQSVWDWLDEPAHMPLIEDVWSNMKFGLRIKNAKVTPRIVCTTTPKPIKWLKKLIADPKTRVSRVSTYANITNLAETFASAVLDEYEGTRIGRQELHGELLEDVEGALWSIDLITYAVKVPESFDRIVVAIDPAGSANKHSDETGIVVLGIADGIIYILADRTGKYSPSGWATAAVNAYNEYSADAIVAEKNYGGDMVREVLEKNGAGDIRIILVHSRRGKALRAEPIVALYEREKVKHIKDATPTLEDEQTSWVPPSSGGKMPSPNRVDALVHGATELANVRLPVELAPPPTDNRTSNSVPTAYGARRDPSMLVPSGR